MSTVEKSDVQILATGTGFSIIGKLTGRALHAVGQIIMAQFLGPVQFGLYAIGWTLFRIISLIAPMGLDQGVIRFASDTQINQRSQIKSILIQIFKLALISGLLIGIIIFFTAPWLATTFFQKPDLKIVFRWFAFGIPAISLLKVSSASTLVSQNVKYAIYSEELLQPAANMVLVIIFYWMGLGLIGTLAASVSSFIIALILAYHYIKKLYPGLYDNISKSPINNKTLLTFSLPSAMGVTFSILITLNDRIMLGYFRSEFEAGIYQAILLFSLFFITVLSAIKTIFAPMISELYQSGNKRRVHDLFRVSTKWGLYLCIPVILIIVFNAEDVIALIYGKDYLLGVTALVILTLGQLANIGTGPIDYVLIMTGHQNDWVVTTGIMFLFNTVLNLMLIPTYGIIGASLSVAITTVITYFSGLIRTRWVLKFWPYDRRYIKGGIASIAVILFLVMVNTFKTSSLILNLVFVSLSSVGIFGIVLVVLGVDIEDRELFLILRNRIRIYFVNE